ncbi:MAG: succinate dehydrogenase/fumarate reductase iron-sulfur subunit [Nitrososphaerota archaeon]|jgi:succinate dehydrogenase / fumarate reductase iron-sulfur subunit|nr:succinate dehydrogenase/fumarate reductase iron-sulfur subunit [Nitrososphaerota archaeon]MDG6927508.1 succinate dehydrogenase/fumarate reductase iron-sulfur subunit [Nitrososphaerota archaeon]MDG6931297.1 succinate dehydrogenase/fumarate reductase iron-sulfur subunit [Nitrososphaerota archaeon]MDG6932441.1 succinate dehydrogenase/fumarate reductase iron-sulfur subunit [Nitrososphaerota archaeon]MDG6936051.1 succinate dehydrogenase/fumarate reductase iron-sulfur subunit [Nitrososphaerota arc
MKIRILRNDGSKQWWQEYSEEPHKGATVLDVLLNIRETQDHTLAFRHSCQMGSCGSCGMVINGKPSLACQTRITELKSETIRIEPLYSYPVIKDLVVDLNDFVNKHRSVKPYIIRKNPQELEEAPMEFRVTSRENMNFIQYDYCIMCGLCVAACPTVALDPQFTGPQALAQAYRYIADPRDEGFQERQPELDTSHGVWRCHFAGSCSFVCPKGVDPAKAIQLLKREILKRKFVRGPRAGAPASVLVQPEKPISNPPKAPPLDFKMGVNQNE